MDEHERTMQQLARREIGIDVAEFVRECARYKYGGAIMVGQIIFQVPGSGPGSDWWAMPKYQLRPAGWVN